MSKVTKPNYTIDIDPDVCTTMQRLMYDADSQKSIIDMYLTDHMYDPDASALDSPVFKTFQARCTDAYGKFETAKAEFQKKYVPEKLIQNYSVQWNLNFATNQLELFVEGNLDEQTIDSFCQ